MIKNKNIQDLVKKYNENKLSHVFLIETNDKESALTDIKELIKILNCFDNQFHENCSKCNLCHLISTNALPSVKIVFPDGQAIKKEQMVMLKQDFQSVPYLSRFNVYIINDAEKFNASSANMMLKFIEEPAPNILGFLITNNRENVIHTIKSRCEIIRANYEEEKSTASENLEQLAIDYLYKIEVEKQQGIVYNKFVMDAKLEREEIVPFFQAIYHIYLCLFQNKDIDDKLRGLKTLARSDILKRMSLVMNILEHANYNVNIPLLLDDFVLRLED